MTLGGKVKKKLLAPMGDGAEIHTRAVGHCVRDIEGVAAFQIVRGRDGLTLSLVYRGELPEQVEAVIRSRLRQVHPLLAEMRIQTVGTLLQSASAKTPVIITQPEMDD